MSREAKKVAVPSNHPSPAVSSYSSGIEKYLRTVVMQVVSSVMDDFEDEDEEIMESDDTTRGHHQYISSDRDILEKVEFVIQHHYNDMPESLSLTSTLSASQSEDKSHQRHIKGYRTHLSLHEHGTKVASNPTMKSVGWRTSTTGTINEIASSNAHGDGNPGRRPVKRRKSSSRSRSFTGISIPPSTSFVPSPIPPSIFGSCKTEAWGSFHSRHRTKTSQSRRQKDPSTRWPFWKILLRFVTLCRCTKRFRSNGRYDADNESHTDGVRRHKKSSKKRKQRSDQMSQKHSYRGTAQASYTPSIPFAFLDEHNIIINE